MRRPLRPAVALAALTLVLPGCGLVDDPQPAEDLGTLTGAGRPLDEGGLRSVLPSPGDLGDGWGEDPAGTLFETRAAEVTPSSCAPLVLKGPGWDEVQQTSRGRAQANFAASDNQPPPGTQRRHVAVWAYSYDEPYPVRLFDEAGAEVADCSQFSIVQRDTGNSSAYEADALTFPALGDRTLALRLTIHQTMETLTMDFVAVKVGHNTFTVVNGTYNGTPDTALTERTARATLDGLEEAS
ncbi:hypothetical protein [Janibacter terrae]|uniref:hypothetical protein n=1 Tax=Janibacter terrae TaxID=103817 RepID=UPI0031F9E7D4